MIIGTLLICVSLGQADDARAEAKRKLEEALRSPDVRVRLAAVRALPAKPCADVEPLLKIAAADEKFNVRLAVVDKLEEVGAGKPGGCVDLRPIATYDDDLSLADYRTHKMHAAKPDTGVQCSSKTDWTALKEKCVTDKALRAIMRGDHKEARYYAAMRAMAEASGVRAEAMRVLRGALRDSTRGPKRPGVEKTEGWVVRWAPLMLEHVADRDRLPILRAALRYRGDANVRTNAVDAVGRYNIAPEQKIALLAPLAKDKSPQVRWRVARALGPIDNPQARALINALAKDKSWWVQREAARWATPGGRTDAPSVDSSASVAAMASPDFRVSLRAAGAILGATK
jgi:HEAT repeat protein